MSLILLTTHTVCRGMTTYDFIVHEQKRQRDKSPTAGAAPAAELNTEVVEAEDETLRGGGGSDEEDGELSPEAEAALKAEQIEMTAQMSQKILEQQQLRAMQGDLEGGHYVPDPDPIVDLYNRQQRQLPQGRATPNNLLNDYIPSRLPRPLDSPDKGGVSSSASSVSSSGSNIEFYADQFAASNAYTVVDSADVPFPPLTKVRLAQVQVARQTLNSSRQGQGEGQGQGLNSPGGVGSWNAGPKSVLQLEQDSPKNKVSIWTRRPSQNAYSGGGGTDGLEFDGTSSTDKEEVKYFTQPMTPPPRPIYQGIRVPANKAANGLGSPGLSSPVPINPFADVTDKEKLKGQYVGEEEKDVTKNTQAVK
jgi:hypothetical protein